MAGGSAKQGRKREFQAVLPIRGKILNVERARLDKMLSSEQVTNIIAALGTGIRDDFDLSKLRYHKIIIMTDADVDGAHIRTLLLTFFYRQMVELVEKGHVFIAQPPLYKVSRGKSETYLKDQRALEDYLVEQGLDETVLVSPAPGEERAGKDLRAIVDQARGVVGLIDGLHSRYSRSVVEQAAIAGAFDAQLLHSAEQANGIADADRGAARRHLRGDGEGLGGPLRQRRLPLQARGARRDRDARARSAPCSARSMRAASTSATSIWPRSTARRPSCGARAETIPVYGPRTLLEAVYEAGRKGISMQRYKGLGEMNPDQLWETTLNRDVRTLLQVKIGDLTEADEIFSKLMGDVVEPRREFIQENALSVSNLDV